MLTIKPAGRGNWAPVVMSVSGKRIDPLLVRVGQTLVLAGVVWRICEVLP